MKVFISCPVENKSVKEVGAILAKAIRVCKNKGWEYVNPFEKETVFTGINMLGKSISKMEGCDTFLFCGDLECLYNSKRYFMELAIALKYGIENIYFYDINNDKILSIKPEELKMFKTIILDFSSTISLNIVTI